MDSSIAKYQPKRISLFLPKEINSSKYKEMSFN